MTAKDPIEIPQIARGGPFFELQRRLKLLEDQRPKVYTRAAIFVAVCWGVPLLLSLLEGQAFGPVDEKPYVLHLGVWARFFIAVGIFVAMEAHVESYLERNLRPLLCAPLLADSARDAAKQAVLRALRRRDSNLAEAVCLLLAILLSIPVYLQMSALHETSWAFRMTQEEAKLTWAAYWCLAISGPLFFFLLLRWIWRICLLGMLLRDLARLDLRLTVTHPDGFAGIGFLGTFPNAYTPFVFGVSCVIGASLAEMLLRGTIQPASYATVMGAWLAVVHVSLALPLLSFGKKLADVKSRTLERASELATRRESAVEKTVLGHNICAPDEALTDVPDDTQNPSIVYSAATKLPTILFSRSTLLPVSAAALLPLLAAGSTQLPIADLFKVLKRLLLI